MRRLLFLLVLAGLICGGTQTASAVNYIDTVLIYWNNLDTISGASIAADSAPRIRIYTPVGGSPTLVRNALMTQDTAGLYYYAFAIPDSTKTYSYKVRWTSQGKAYLFGKGRISADNIIQKIDTVLVQRFDSVYVALDTIYQLVDTVLAVAISFADTSGWMTQQEFDSNLYIAVVEGGNEIMPGLVQNPGFEGDSIQGSVGTPDGWTKLEGTGTTTFHAQHGSQRSSEYSLHLGRWMYRMRLSANDTVIYYQRLYLTPGVYIMTGYLLMYSDIIGGCVTTLFMDSSAAPTLFNYKDSIKVTAGIDNTLQQYSKVVLISASGYYSFGVRYVHNGGTTTFCQMDNLNVFPLSPLIVIADTTQSGAGFGSIDYALIGAAVWNNAYVTEANRTVNVAQISGDATPADKLEAMFDGTGNVTMYANLKGFVYEGSANIVSNGLFSWGDSVSGVTAPSMWTNQVGGSLTLNRVVSATRFGKWNYVLRRDGADSMIYYQGIGFIAPGRYLLHGVMANRGGSRAMVFLDTCLTTDCASRATLDQAYVDSLYWNGSTNDFRLQTTEVTIPATDKPWMIGLKWISNSTNDSCIFANIGLIPGQITAISGSGSGNDSLQIRRWTWAPDSTIFGNLGRNVDNGGVVNINYDSVYNSVLLALIANPGLMTGNIILNGSFGNDSVSADTVPRDWLLAGTDLDSALTLRYDTVGSYGRWYYRLLATAATPNDTLVIYQKLGYLLPGDYLVSARVKTAGVPGWALFMDDADANYQEGYLDSLSFTAVGAWNRFFLTATVSIAGYYYVGVRIRTNSVNDYGYFDDFRCEYKAPDTTDIKALAFNNPAIFGGDSSGGAGSCLSGPVTILYYVIDSTGSTLAESLLVGADVGGWSLASGNYGMAKTSTSGCGAFTAQVGDTLVVTAFEIGYTFPKPDTIVVPSSFLYVDTIVGYSTLDASKCRVWFYAADVGSDPLLKNAKFVATLQAGGGVMDTCNGRIIPTFEKWSVAPDTLGKFEIDLIQNTCMAPENLQYKGEIRIGTRVLRDLGLFTVPDSATYRLVIETN